MKKKEKSLKETIDDVKLFFMIVCHQSYEDIKKIPAEDGIRLMKRYKQIMKNGMAGMI